MELKKKAKSFNNYTLELSFGQLEAIVASLERDHADPVADELFAELQWYIQRVPGPGEEEEDTKAREEGAVETGATATGDVEGEDVPIPMPPTEGAVDNEEPSLPPGAEGAEGGEDMGGELDSPEGMADYLGAGSEEPPAEGEDLDKLPAPPAG